MSFMHESRAQRVAFGAGQALEFVRAELSRTPSIRPLLIVGSAGTTLAAAISADLPAARIWDEVIQHVPAEIAERARAAAGDADADAIVSIGGGSATGLAKAVALTTGLPIIAVPTTYAGSEATDVWGVTEDGRKITGTDPRVLPRTVVYDSMLTASLPVPLSISSGLNALAHCVDALWAPRANPINAGTALEGARALRVALRALIADPRDSDARDGCLYGTYLAGVAFASAGSGMHHKICHVLGGTLDLPHAATHAVVLPYVLAHNTPGASRQARRLAVALGAQTVAPESALVALQTLRTQLGAPRSLGELGMTEQDIPVVLPQILHSIPSSNPVPVTEQSVAGLLRAAIRGAEPIVKEDA
ncbi:maleylacetate reductase [Microbacterium kribbense]